MKLNRLSFHSLATLTSLLILTACNKNSNNNSNSSGSLSATISGTAFTANSTAGAYISSIGQYFVIGYYIQSKDTTGIQITLPYLPPLNHPVSTDSVGLADLTYVVSGKEYDAYFGLGNSQAVFTLTVADTVGHNLAGTFSGVLYNDANVNDSVVITNGKFSSSYTIE